MNKHLNRIIPALITALSESHPDFESAESVILSVQKEPGPAFLIEELVKGCRETRPEVRATAMRLLHVLSSKSSADLTEHVPQLMIFTTESLNDPSDKVCEAAWLALEAIVKVSVYKLQLTQYWPGQVKNCQKLSLATRLAPSWSLYCMAKLHPPLVT